MLRTAYCLAVSLAALTAPLQAQGGLAPAPGKPTYTAADVAFMQGMIHHHAQAILIAGWAPSHDASGSVAALCQRIVAGQSDEIATMQTWLRLRGQTVPKPDTGMHAMMPSMDPATMMPGMLDDQQLASLDRARGRQFDSLFLVDMIQHHNGAITMVNALFGRGSGEDETVYKFASDVYAAQTTEIARMQRMLGVIIFGPN